MLDQRCNALILALKNRELVVVGPWSFLQVERREGANEIVQGQMKPPTNNLVRGTLNRKQTPRSGSQPQKSEIKDRQHRSTKAVPDCLLFWQGSLPLHHGMDLVLTQSMPLMNRNEAVAQHGYTHGCPSQNLEARAIDQKNSTGLRSSSLPHGVFLL